MMRLNITIVVLLLLPSFAWAWIPNSPPTRTTARPLHFEAVARRQKEKQQVDARNANDTVDNVGFNSRRWFAKQLGILLGTSTGAVVADSLPSSSWMNPVGPTTTSTNAVAHAAPPIAVIAEELGYFPVTNADHETIYVPKRIKRESSDQAIQLARKLRESGAVVYTAFWCPHCARQKELFGREAWKEVRNVECAPKGYNAQPGICLAKQVDGYPTMILGNGKRISGERSLSDIAREVGFNGFKDDLETNVPPPLGSSACR